MEKISWVKMQKVWGIWLCIVSEPEKRKI
jgi:hypothetical protein